MNKRIFSLILTACLTIMAMPKITFAEEDVTLLNNTEDTIEYNLDEIRDENDNYKIPYNYLKQYYSEYNCFLYKGQDFVPTFILTHSNIQNILDTKDESFVLDFNINGESFDESPSVLSGLSKEFYDTYSNQIYRWVYYKTNLGNDVFNDNNIVSFPLESKDVKAGDTVYLYSTSNLEDGRVELVSEVVLNENNILEEMSFGQVTFDTNVDVSDRAFFLTTSKIEMVEKDNSYLEEISKKEDTSSLKNNLKVLLLGIVLISSTTVLYLMVIKKDKKKDN